MSIPDTRKHPHTMPEDLRSVLPDSVEDQATQLMRAAAAQQVIRINGANAATLLRMLGLTREEDD